jgi:Protein of unknown function (DUF2865)
MSNRGSDAFHRRLLQLITLALTAVLVALPLSTASAGLLDMLFGRVQRPPPPQLPPQVQAYAPTAPAARETPAAVPARETPASTYSGRGTVYCVRLCDGRYFPVARHAGVSPAQTCSSFCPASETKIYSGSNIAYAVAHDGTRYSSLANAFLYRKQIVAGCTCNGRDAFGLAPIDTASDTTLRKGDIVATRNGLVSFSGRLGANGERNFTPVSSYAGLSADLRRRLSETKVVPIRAATALPTDQARLASERQALLYR